MRTRNPRDFGDRLNRTDLVVGVQDADEERVPGDRLADVVGVDATEERCDLRAGAIQSSHCRRARPVAARKDCHRRAQEAAADPAGPLPNPICFVPQGSLPVPGPAKTPAPCPLRASARQAHPSRCAEHLR